MFAATEIRCTEEAKGGLKYDVILAEAATEPPQIRAPSPVNVSEDDIIEKLKAAEERRQVRSEMKIELDKFANF